MARTLLISCRTAPYKSLQSSFMLNKKRSDHSGFTLVEIMVVVAIIALLAAIAVPGFLRARKRSQATAILNDARVIGGAIDQYAIESNVLGSSTFTSARLKGFFKPASRLYVEAGSGTVFNDILGNNYSYSTWDGNVRVNSATTDNFSDVIDNASSFWGGYQ
jgi:prepilin-type N-terminal cleavage/methylation domain-containing protein